MKLIFPILFILVSIGTFIFGVNPLYKEVSILKSDIAVYDTALNNSTNLQKTEDSLAKSYNEISQGDKDRLNHFLPSSVDNIQFILEVEHIANLRGMLIKDLKFDPTKKDSTATDPNIIVSDIGSDNRPYGVFPIEFTTEGNYDTFLLFLKDLEYNLRLVDVKSVSFSVPVNNANIAIGVDPNVYSYVLKAEIYWLK